VEISDTSLVGLGLPVNSGANEGDFFISNDESFMIFMSNRPGGYGSADLYISYSKPDDSWTNPKNLGPFVNTSGDDFGPYVTTDNKYLFYESGYTSPSSIYWLRVDQLIDSLTYTNFVPYVKNPIPDQTAIKGEPFTLTIPDSTFVDDDGNNTLIYGAKLTNGDPLPSWLSFDSTTATFSGIPPVIETLNIRVTATDTAGVAASTSFKIIVSNAVSIGQINGQGESVTIFPNPSNGLINISSDLSGKKMAMVEIINLEGKVVMQDAFKNKMLIDLTSNPKGIYVIRIIACNEIITSKICLE
jgi:hypothetical protein